MPAAGSEPAYRWVIVAAGALMSCVSVGAMFSLTVFLQPMAEATGWSRAGISGAMTINFLTMGVAGFMWGAISDRYGARIVVLAGGALLGLGLVLASGTSTLPQFQLVYGILVGLAVGAFFAPLIAATTAWFETNRSLAVSLVSAGMGVAPLTVSPLAQWLISTYEWRPAMLAIGLLSWVILLPTALLIRTPPQVAPPAASGTRAPVEEAGLTVGQALRTPQFIALALTFFFCCAAHSGPIFHMVSYAVGCGLSAMAAVSVYGVQGLGGLGGRLLLGVLADRLGVKKVLIAGLLVQAAAIATYVLVHRPEQFYVLAVIFGTAYGGVMPLYAVLAREYFGQRIMGTVFGAITMTSSIGMAFGPLMGGWVYDTFDAYTWLFIGSAAVGLGAVAVALTFPPLPTRTAPRLQPA